LKKIVYTVLLGDYKLNEPEYINKDWVLLCFTDKDLVSKNWNIIKIKTDSPRKKSREIKIRSDKYFNYDLCIHLDAKFTIKCDLNKFVARNLSTDLAVMKHNKRSCVYAEAKFCISIGKDSEEVLLNQIDCYKKDGFPNSFGLYAPGIMIKRNSQEVTEFMKMWYDEVNRHSYRDIVSFSYVLWKKPIKINLMPFKETYMRFK